MNGIQSRLAFVSCVGKLEEVKNSSFYNYIRPPINRFVTLRLGLYIFDFELTETLSKKNRKGTRFSDCSFKTGHETKLEYTPNF